MNLTIERCDECQENIKPARRLFLRGRVYHAQDCYITFCKREAMTAWEELLKPAVPKRLFQVKRER